MDNKSLCCRCRWKITWKGCRGMAEDWRWYTKARGWREYKGGQVSICVSETRPNNECVNGS